MSAQPVETERTAVELAGDYVRDALTACLLSADSNRSTTPVLASVLVESTGTEVRFTATERHVLTRVVVEAEGPEFRALLPRDDAQRFARGIPKSNARTTAGPGLPVSLAVVDGRLWLYVPGSSMSAELMDGEYPKVESILPAPDRKTELPEGRVGIAPDYLAKLAKMPGRHRSEPVVFNFAGPGKPVLTTWGEKPISFTHLIMPVRFAS